MYTFPLVFKFTLNIQQRETWWNVHQILFFQDMKIRHLEKELAEEKRKSKKLLLGNFVKKHYLNQQSYSWINFLNFYPKDKSDSRKSEKMPTTLQARTTHVERQRKKGVKWKSKESQKTEKLNEISSQIVPNTQLFVRLLKNKIVLLEQRWLFRGTSHHTKKIPIPFFFQKPLEKIQ